MPYHLLTGQLIYTKIEETKERLVTSDLVPHEIQTAFLSRLQQYQSKLLQHSHPGYRAVYIYQITPEQNLFGWMYDGGIDGMKSSNPYFICYYLAEPLLFSFQLETIFNCLHKGPVELLERTNLPNNLRALIVQNYWSYKSARSGVVIPPNIRARSHLDLKQAELLDLFFLAEKPQISHELSAPTCEQEIANIAIYTRYLVKAVETGKTTLARDPKALASEAIAPYLNYQEKLQQYQQALLMANQQEHSSRDRTRQRLKLLQQELQLKKDDLALIEDLARQNKLPSLHSSTTPSPDRRRDRDKQTSGKTFLVLSNVGIAATILLVIVSCYSVLKTSIAPSKQVNSIQIFSEQQ